MTDVVKEIYVGKVDKSLDLTVTMILENNKEIRLQLSRELVHNLQEALFVGLDTFGIFKPEKMDS